MPILGIQLRESNYASFCQRARDRQTDLIITASDEAFYILFACGDSLPLQIPVVFSALSILIWS